MMTNSTEGYFRWDLGYGVQLDFTETTGRNVGLRMTAEEAGTAQTIIPSSVLKGVISALAKMVDERAVMVFTDPDTGDGGIHVAMRAVDGYNGSITTTDGVTRACMFAGTSPNFLSYMLLDKDFERTDNAYHTLTWAEIASVEVW